jgi:tRNA U34 5-methylaminomethyl-2-thiouridine-forming methyltransferase MnmC
MMATGKIFETQDGSHSVFSEQYGVSYHSRYGAIQESRHVFIESALFYMLPAQKELSILEIGLGTGLNAVLTLLEAERHGANIHYEAIEAFPLSLEQARQLNYPSLLGNLADDYFLQLHLLGWGSAHQLTPHFSFCKHRQHFEEVDYEAAFDIIYFDAFAPDAQPELWEANVMARMYQALKPTGILVTYCAKGAVKRTLKEVGFTIEALKGPPGKREMTRAQKTG